MANFTNITANFSNSWSIQNNMACDTFDVSFAVKITRMLVFCIIILLSVVGNTLIVTIVCKRPELRNTVNYFIVNMAVSDILAATAAPVQLAEIAASSLKWQIDGTAGLVFCKLITFVYQLSIAVSVQSLVWIALDRFVAVVFPMKAHLISSRFRAFAIASTWTVAMIIKSLDLYVVLDLVEIYDGVNVCAQDFETTAFWYRDYARAYTAIFHVAPVILVTLLYCIIVLTLRRQEKHLGSKEVHQRTRRKQGAIRTSFCAMAAFNICVLPLISFYMLLEYEIPMSCSLYKVVWILSYTLFYSSSTTNPIICITFVRGYRRGLREIFNSCCNERLPRLQQKAKENTDEITLQMFRVIPGTRENLAFSDK